MRVEDVDEKAPGETIPLTFKFGKLTSDIATAVITLSVRRGNDPGMDLMTFGGYQIVGTEVRQLVRAGLDQNNYLARCDITNAAGEKYSHALDLPVRELR